MITNTIDILKILTNADSFLGKYGFKLSYLSNSKVPYMPILFDYKSQAIFRGNVENLPLFIDNMGNIKQLYITEVEGQNKISFVVLDRGHLYNILAENEIIGIHFVPMLRAITLVSKSFVEQNRQSPDVLGWEDFYTTITHWCNSRKNPHTILLHTKRMKKNEQDCMLPIAIFDNTFSHLVNDFKTALGKTVLNEDLIQQTDTRKNSNSIQSISYWVSLKNTMEFLGLDSVTGVTAPFLLEAFLHNAGFRPSKDENIKYFHREWTAEINDLGLVRYKLVSQ